MYKTIIVPVDLSHAEKGAEMIDHARKLGGEGARIVLVNIVEDVPPYIAAQFPSGLMEKSKQHARGELETMTETAGLKADIKVRYGKPHRAILDIADEMGADLIVIGSHRPGFEDYLLGSTAARVVRHATAPCS